MRRCVASAIAVLLLCAFISLFAAGCGNGSDPDAERYFDTEPLQKIQVGDITIGYKEFGTQNENPLFMIAGYSMTMDVWDPRFLDDLSKKFKVIVFDSRGMGETTGGRKKWTIDQFGDDTAGFIRALGYKSADLLGWSLGGDVALSVAVYHPEVIKKLISYAGDCGGTQKILPPSYKDVVAKLRYVNAPLKIVLAALYPPWYIDLYPDYYRHFPFPHELSSVTDIMRQDKAYNTWKGVYDRLGDINMPVLAATGKMDESTPEANAIMLSEKIPNCTLVKFIGAGHGIQYMFPHQFAKVIINWTSGKPVSPIQR